MALEEYQYIIDIDTLYKLKTSNISILEHLRYNIEVIGGSVNIYGTLDEEPASPPVGMFKTRENFIGIIAFDIIPKYLYLTGTATKIILTGIKPTEV